MIQNLNISNPQTLKILENIIDKDDLEMIEKPMSMSSKTSKDELSFYDISNPSKCRKDGLEEESKENKYESDANSGINTFKSLNLIELK